MRTWSFVLSLVFLGLSGASRPALAEESSGATVYLGLEQVARPFCSEQLSRASSVVDRKKLQAENPRTTPAALKETPGLFSAGTTYGHGTPVIRGFIGRNNLLLVDGIRLNNGTYRSGPSQYLNTVDNMMIDRIEIIRGPGSTLFGSDAMGGVVNAIVRKAPEPAGCPYMDKSFAARFSSSDQGMVGRGEVSGAEGSVGYLAGISYKKFADLRAGGDRETQKPTGYDEYDYNADVSYRINQEQRVAISHQYTRQNAVPRYDKYATARTFIAQSYSLYQYDPQVRSLWNVRYAADAPHPGISALAVDLSYQEQSEIQKQQKIGSTTLAVYDDSVRTAGAAVRLESAVTEEHLLKYGADAYKDTVTSAKENRNTATGVITARPLESTFPDGSTYETLGAYLQDTYAVSDAFSLIAGGRYSRCAVNSELRNAPLSGSYTETFEGGAGNIGFLWGITDAFALVGSLAQGIRAPNLDDTVTLQTTNQGVDVPVSGLKPEKSLTTELGLKKQGRLSGSLTAYVSDVTDLIERKPGTYNGLSYIDDNANGAYDTSDRLVWQKTNVGKAWIQGLEMEGKYALNPRWNLWGNLACTWGENLTDNEPLTRIPPLFGTCGSWWKTSSKTWVETYAAFAAAQNRLSSRDLADPRIQPDGTPGWITGNARGGIALTDQAELSLSVENILDAAYRLHGSGIDASGRNITITYRQTF